MAKNNGFVGTAINIYMEIKHKPIGFYVYAYLRKEDLTPYYIGKGKGKRLYGPHNVSIPKDHTKILIIEQNLTDQEAMDLEIELINRYGRKDNSTGILHNLTNGGDGSAGHIKSKETVDKHRVQLKGRVSWTKDGKSVRSIDCPGPEWVRGNGQNGKVWWNNRTDEVWQREIPGEEWIRGRAPASVKRLNEQASAAGKKRAHLRWGSPL